MINNLLSIISQQDFLDIKDNLSVEQFITQVFPKGFENLVNVHHDEFTCFVTSTNEDLGYTLEIQISNSLFNPNFRKFPRFLFTDLNKNLCNINQNQLIHLMLVYRLNQMKSMSRPYLNLISSDMSAILRYIEYTEANSYNAKIKNDNLTVVVHYPKLANLLTDFSETFISSNLSEDHWNAFYAKNPVHVSSVGSVSSSNAVVLREGMKGNYRSVGYKPTSDGFYSIFPAAQNVPARTQTHLLGDSFKISNSCQSIYQQDNLMENGVLVPKDKSLKAGVVVFHPIEESGRFLSGEIEIDTYIAGQLLEVTTNVEDCFKELHVKKGETYSPKFEDFVIGINNLDDEVIISNATEINILDVFTTGISGAKRIKMKVTKRADNARITSNTGLKGVTKVVTQLGQIQFASPDEVLETEIPEDINSNDIKFLKRRYPTLDLDKLDNFSGITRDHKPLIINPNLVCGMNSVKAKSNTIVLGQAALAVHLGFYTPSVKHGIEGLLDTYDMKEINEAANSLPEYTYINGEGHEVKVEIGLVYISYTEMCSTYTKVKPQSFPFIAGYYMAKNNPTTKAVYDYIWQNYLEKEKIDAAKELYKILLTHETGIVDNSDNLPMYNIEAINEIFNSNDLVLTVENEFPTCSKLLDEDFNKGFFIDLSKYENAPTIRIPSAKTLNMFSGRLKNGSFIYHINLINVSKILKGCLKTEKGISLNTVYSKDKSRQVSSLAYYAFLNTIRSTIFSGEHASHQIVQSFIKPKIKGCNFKQISEHHLPANTVVINDDRVYNSLLSESLKGSGASILASQIEMVALTLKLETSTCIEEQKELFELINQEGPRSIALRQPFLWEEQLEVAYIWDRHMYEIYLKLYHNKSLNEVMDTYYNRDILLVAQNLIISSKSDCDILMSP